MNVRFLKPYSPDWDINISYELVSDEIEFWSECTGAGKYTTTEPCYNLKLLGWVPIRKLEEAEPTDYPAIDIWAVLSNL